MKHKRWLLGVLCTVLAVGVGVGLNPADETLQFKPFEGVYEVRDSETGELVCIVDPYIHPEKPEPKAVPSYQAGWPVSGVTGHFLSGDIDGDGDLEVVLINNSGVVIYHHEGSSFAGWPQPGGVSSLADLDGDGTLEIITGAVVDEMGYPKGQLRCYSSDGSLLWSKENSIDQWEYRFQTPAIADVDGDGSLDIFSVAKSDCSTMCMDQLWLLQGDGTPFAGFPFYVSGNGRQIYSLTDVDDDGDLEIQISAWEAWHHDGSVVAGYPLATGLAPYIVANSDGVPGNELVGANGSGKMMTNLGMGSLPGWPQVPCHNGSSQPSLGDTNGDGQLNVAFSTVNICAPGTTGYSYLYNTDGTLMPGWPVSKGNYSSSDQTLIGDTDNDGQLNFINGGREGSFNPIGKVFNFNADGTDAPDFPIVFPYPDYIFQAANGILMDLDLDGDVELGLIGVPSIGTVSALIWDLPAPYKPETMFWRQRGGNMQHTGEYHDPSYYIPAVQTVSPALTWVTSCPVASFEIRGGNSESKPVVWFVPVADTAAFYGGDLTKGLKASFVAMPQIHPDLGSPQNPLNASFLSVTPPALPLGQYELVIQNPTGIRNPAPRPVITVTDTSTLNPVGDTLMVAKSGSNDTLQFDWTDVSNPEYVVRYTLDPSLSFDDDLAHSLTNTLTSDTAVQTLYFKVMGVDSCGVSP